MSDVHIDIIQRPQLLEVLDGLIESHLSRNKEFALMLVRLNNFRQLNIAHGFHQGDNILTALYQCIQRVGRDQDHIFRVGAAEFLVIVQNVHNDGHASLAAIKLLNEIETGSGIDEKSIRFNVHIGIALYPSHGQNSTELLRNTEITLLEAQQNIEPYSIFPDDADQCDITRWDISSELQVAIENDQFELYFQPQVHIESGDVFGAEALIRWKHPDRNYVKPGTFIPVAEQGGLIHPITDWTIHNALWLIKEWPRAKQPLNVSINLSPEVIMHEGLVESVINSANIFNANLKYLTFEITESALMADMPSTIKILEELRSEGVNISIDDFGTGHSSMAYFKNIPANELKIDRTFVTNMLENPMDLHIVRSAVDMAQGFGLRVIAEGIENLETFEMLKTLGCDVGQGFYISDPLPQDSLIDWINRYSEACSVLATP